MSNITPMNEQLIDQNPFQWDNFWITGNINISGTDKHRLCANAMYAWSMMGLPGVPTPDCFSLVMDLIGKELGVIPSPAGLRSWYNNNPVNGKICAYIPDKGKINTKRRAVNPL